MPNWCDNSLTISHDDKLKIDELEAALLKENPEIFQFLRPRPKDQDENWYDWNIENWGTKWDVNLDFVERVSENTIVLGFNTAWSPPIELYDYLTEQGWRINAMYSEGGVGFVGRYEDGVDDCYEYSFDEELSIELIPEELVEYAGIWEAYEWHKEYLKEQEEQEKKDDEG